MICYYADFHDISKQQAADIMNGCGTLDGYTDEDMVIIGHMNRCKLVSMLRWIVEKRGGKNPPAVLPKQMGLQTITELYPYWDRPTDSRIEG